MGHGVAPDRRDQLTARRDELRDQYLKPRGIRPGSSARGIHHAAHICSDVEATIRFYDELLGFPLIEMFENRDYEGSTHFFFDLGGGNCLAYFDLPGLDLGEYREVLGGHHHLAISMDPEQWQAAKERLEAAGVETAHVDGTSLYFRGPDGERLELIADPPRWMYGKAVG